MSKKKKIIVIISSIILVLVAIFTSTYSLFYKETVATNPSNYTTGLLQIEALSMTDKISLDESLPMTDTDGAKETPYIFSIKNTGNVDYKFNVKLLSTSSNTINANYIKVKIDDNDPVTLSSLTNSIIKQDVIVKAKESITITLRIWLSTDTPNSEIGKTFNSQIVIDGQSIYTESNYDANNKQGTLGNAAEYITSLYEDAEKSTVVNNEITYNIAPSVNLMNDRLGGTTTSLDGGNIRYYGASPNNYIYFNCSDYNNQTSDTCELWRIIGVFDGKLKIMRNEIIGTYSWDTSASTINNGWGINEWSQADLMKLFNPGYESESVGGSLYYNSGSGTCYSGSSNSTTSCDFTSAGIKNDATRNKIATVTWNTGGNSYSNRDIYSNQWYSQERGTTVVVPGTTCSGTYCNDTVTRQTTWTGKIALAYPSDYGYATDFTKCSNTLGNYSDSTDSYACRSNDWMYPIVTNSGSSVGWLLAPYSGNAYLVWVVASAGSVGNSYSNAYGAFGVAPVLYLGSDAILESGTGSNLDPYRLG